MVYSDVDEIDAMFSAWMREYKKDYTPEEQAARRPLLGVVGVCWASCRLGIICTNVVLWFETDGAFRD